MTTSIITPAARQRCAAHTLKDQLAQLRAQMTPDEHVKLVDKLLSDRRRRQVGISRERRDPTRKGWERVHFDNDTATDSV